MIYNGVLNVSLSDYKCNSCTLYLVLFVVFFAAYALAVFLFFFIAIQKKIFQTFVTCINKNPQVS